jgi:hypothetical protein
MRSTKGLVMEILSSMENDEIYEECLRYGIPVSEHDTRERMVSQIVQFVQIEGGEI